MATIRQRGPGVWEVRQYTGRGGDGRSTQISRTVRGTKKDSKRVAATLTLAPPTRAASHTVAEMLDAWIAQNDPTWSESSRRDQRNRAELVRSDRLAKVKLSKLSVADIERWHSRLRMAGVGEGSIRNRHQGPAGRTHVGPAVGVGDGQPGCRGPAVGAPAFGAGVYDRDDIRQVLSAARQVEPHAELALRIAAVTGARRSELAALRWDELDGDRLTIDSSASVIRTDGEKRVLVDAETKTGNRRVVTLDPQTVALAEELRAISGEYTAWMFSLDDEPAHPDRIGHWWRRARKASGIDQEWRLHDLRHWSATMAIASGHDIRTVANRLGHSNPAMTLRVYAHALDASDRGVSETMGRLLSDEHE